MTRTERLAAFFRQHPGQWIDGRDLEFAGRYAWRSRVSDVRRSPHFLNIENRQRTVRRDDGSALVVSEYRCVMETEDKNERRMPESQHPPSSLF